MSASDKIDSLNGLWNLNPVVAGLVTFGLLFVLFNAVVAYEGLFRRGRYLSLMVNFGVLIPVYVGCSAAVVQDNSFGDAWYTGSGWFWVSFVTPLVAFIVFYAIDRPNYLPEQMRSPAKWTFSLQFVFAVYWLLAPAPAVIATLDDPLAILGLAAAVGCFVVWGLDRVVYPFGGHQDPHVLWYGRKRTSVPRYVEYDKRGPKGGSAARSDRPT